MNLKLFRVSRGMTIDEFSKAIGFSRQQYSLVERGEINPSMRMINSISERFTMPIIDTLNLMKAEGE